MAAPDLEPAHSPNSALFDQRKKNARWNFSRRAALLFAGSFLLRFSVQKIGDQFDSFGNVVEFEVRVNIHREADVAMPHRGLGDFWGRPPLRQECRVGVTPDVFCLMVRIFRLMLLLLYTGCNRRNGQTSGECSLGQTIPI